MTKVAVKVAAKKAACSKMAVRTAVEMVVRAAVEKLANLVAKMVANLAANWHVKWLQICEGEEGATHHSTDRQTGSVDRAAHKAAFSAAQTTMQGGVLMGKGVPEGGGVSPFCS